MHRFSFRPDNSGRRPRSYDRGTESADFGPGQPDAKPSRSEPDFGGAIKARRLAQKWPGKVVVLERGKRYGWGEFHAHPTTSGAIFWVLPDRTRANTENVMTAKPNKTNGKRRVPAEEKLPDRLKRETALQSA